MAEKRVRYTSRTKARKRAADILFEADQKGIVRNPAAVRDLLAERRALTAAPSPLPEYSATIVEGVAGDLPAIDRALGRHAKGAGLDRLPAVDVAVMRVAVWEMLNNSTDVPRVTAIDEAVSVVKDLSTDESPAYVNGVLDAVRKELDQREGPAPAGEEAGGGIEGAAQMSDPVPADPTVDEDVFDEY